ncbi:MAG: TRAP transporter small permease [Lachnospiraceae bacterium]|nr:TRAP transporter small permease [Lachnospiraceae bacterium]
MKKVILALQRAEELLGAVCLCVFLGSVLLQMFSRYLGISIIWTGDVCTYAFILSVFLGAGSMVYNRQHFAFTAIVDKLQGTKKSIIKIFISVVMLFFNGAMFYYGILITEKYWSYTWTTIPSFKKGPLFLVIPVSAGLSILFLIALIVEDIQEMNGKKVEDKKGETK